MHREFNPKDHLYILRYHLRSFFEMLEVLVYLVGAATAIFTSTLCKLLDRNYYGLEQPFLELQDRCQGLFQLEMCTHVSSVKRCSVLLTVWKYMLEDPIMERGHLLVNCVVRLLDMKSAWVNIGEFYFYSHFYSTFFMSPNLFVNFNYLNQPVFLSESVVSDHRIFFFSYFCIL